MMQAKLKTFASGIRMIDARCVKPAPKKADPFYLTPEWRALMKEIIAERGARCEEIGCGRTNTRMFGDHLVEVRDGGALLDKRNVKLLCGSCHTKKTAVARATRMRERY